VLALHQAAAADGTGQLEDTTLVVRAMKGGASGGTIASLKGTVDDARGSRELARVLADPYALSPDRDAEPDLGPEHDLRGVQYDSELKRWVGPFIMGSINTRAVRRSNALQSWAYGRRFRYREVMGFGSGPTGAVQAGALAGGVGALAVGLSVGPARALLDRALPSPGEGPSESRLGESGLCLAFDEQRLPPRAGVLTPATAMGEALIERLRRAGQTLEVTRVD
jgi:short subunit dehydrogenase-like uncharacterized protein